MQMNDHSTSLQPFVNLLLHLGIDSYPRTGIGQRSHQGWIAHARDRCVVGFPEYTAQHRSALAVPCLERRAVRHQQTDNIHVSRARPHVERSRIVLDSAQECRSTIPSEEPDLPFHPRGAWGSSRKTLKTVTERLWAA